MRIIGYIDYAVDSPVAPRYLAGNLNLQLFGWEGQVRFVEVYSEKFNRNGLVLVNSHPTTLGEESECFTYFENELSRERAEAYDEFRDEDDISGEESS